MGTTEFFDLVVQYAVDRYVCGKNKRVARFRGFRPAFRTHGVRWIERTIVVGDTVFEMRDLSVGIEATPGEIDLVHGNRSLLRPAV
jgi:hypothetical protein